MPPSVPLILPIVNSYRLPGTRLYAGEYPGDKYGDVAETRLASFLDAGIDTFIDLTESVEPLEPYAEVLATLARNKGVVHRRFPIPDVSVTDEGGCYGSSVRSTMSWPAGAACTCTAGEALVERGR